MANIHLILQAKGGVGKSVSAWALAQYLMDRTAIKYWNSQKKTQQPEDSMADLSYWETPLAPESYEGNPVLIDIDPLNATLSEFKSLPVKRFNLFEKTGDPYDRYHLRQEIFDEMMDLIFNTSSDIIIDVGSAGFAPFCHYLIESNIFKHLTDKVRKNKHKVFIHTVIAGGDNFFTTVDGFSDLARQIPETQNPADPKSAKIKFIVWLNPYYGQVELNGNTFEDTDAYDEFKERIVGLIRMPNTRRSELFNLAMSTCLEKRWTFREFVRAGSPDEKGNQQVSTMSVSRIVDIRDQYYGELDAMREI